MSASVKAVFFDISGVLIESNQLIQGADQAIKDLRELGLCVRFVTNTATQNAEQICNKLASFNISIEKNELFSAPIAAKRFIQSKQLRPYCLIHPAIKNEFAEIKQSDPNCVLLGDAGNDLNYQNLNKAFQLCHQGAPLISIGYNKYYKANNQLMLDAGAFTHAIEWASGQTALIMGKPSRDFFEQVVASTSFNAEQCLMVGDDVTADVKAAIDAGLQAALVSTGKYQLSDIALLPAKALQINKLADLLSLI